MSVVCYCLFSLTERSSGRRNSSYGKWSGYSTMPGKCRFNHVGKNMRHVKHGRGDVPRELISARWAPSLQESHVVNVLKGRCLSVWPKPEPLFTVQQMDVHIRDNIIHIYINVYSFNQTIVSHSFVSFKVMNCMHSNFHCVFKYDMFSLFHVYAEISEDVWLTSWKSPVNPLVNVCMNPDSMGRAAPMCFTYQVLHKSWHAMRNVSSDVIRHRPLSPVTTHAVTSGNFIANDFKALCFVGLEVSSGSCVYFTLMFWDFCRRTHRQKC